MEDFQLLKLEALPQITNELTSAVEADRILAQTAATTATTKANEASASSVKASQWAENNEDVAVETGKFSAKHYSLKAAAQNAQMQAVYPTAAYRARVLADAGLIKDLSHLTELYIKNLSLLDSTVFLWNGEAGTKRRTSGSNTFASKAYNMANKVQQFGAELVTNGTFTGADGSTPAGWTAFSSSATIDTNRLKITNTVDTFFGYAGQAITTIIGKTYHFTFTGIFNSNFRVRVGTTFGGQDLYLGTFAADTTRTISFIATTTTTYIGFGLNNGTVGAYAFFDNISVKQMDWIDGTNDAVQTTEANQPYLGGLIAPNEVGGLKGMNTRSFEVLSNPISLGFNDSWTATVVFNPTGVRTGQSNNGTLIVGNTFVFYSDASELGKIAIFDSRNSNSTTFLTVGNNSSKIGKNNIIQVVYTSSSIKVLLDGVELQNAVPFQQCGFEMRNLMYTSVLPRNNANILHAQINNRALSASEIQAQHEYLRLQIPEIEGVAIGNQYWATSNYEGVVAGDGSVIPEVQDNAVWATSTTLYDNAYEATPGSPAVKELAALKAAAMWCYYDNDVNNGAIYGKLYNWYAVKLISLYPPQGWRVPVDADFEQLQSVLGGSAVAGGKLKKEGLTNWSVTNTGGTNESGFSLIGTGRRSNAGVFETLGTFSGFWTPEKTRWFVLNNSASLQKTDYSTFLGTGHSLRLLRNSPVGPNETTITSTTIVSDISSTANSTQIPFGYSVASIRLKTTANLTNIKVELWNNFYSGTPTLVSTLITGKTANNTTMVFPVLADAAALLQDGTLRITATGAATFETIVEYNLQKNTF